MSGWLLATQIVEKLSGEKQYACISALQQAGLGQQKLSSGDWNGALALCMGAQAEFSQIPEARPLVGVTNADIAAALGNLGRHAEAKKIAEEALPLVQGVRHLAQTEAALHMTLGIGYYQEGDAQQGAHHFFIARQLYGVVPGAAQMLEIVDSNEAQVKAVHHEKRKRWWKLW